MPITVPLVISTTIDLTTPELGFFSDLSPVNIWRLRDRVFIGDACDYEGSWAGLPDPYGARGWTARDAQLLVESSVGHTAITGQSKTSLAPEEPAHGNAAIGVIGVGVNDDQREDFTRYAFGGYFEAYREENSGPAFGVEIDAGNFGINCTDDPYHMFGDGVFGLNVAAGGSTGRTYTAPSSSALQIANNQSTWNTGIVFGKNAITGTDGVTGYGVAMALAKGHQLVWHCLQGLAARITSKIDDVAKSAGIQFINGGIRFEGPNGSIAGQVESLPNSVNYLRLISYPSGSPAELNCGGDADIDIKITPRGQGMVWLGEYEAATNSILVKDSAGTVRRLLCV